MSEEIKLLPCPFCGVIPSPQGLNFNIIHNSGCVLINTNWIYAGEQVKEWNTRPSPQPKVSATTQDRIRMQDEIQDELASPQPPTAEGVEVENTQSSKHPHEPETPAIYDSEGRCLVCSISYASSTIARKLAEKTVEQYFLKAQVKDLESTVLSMREALEKVQTWLVRNTDIEGENPLLDAVISALSNPLSTSPAAELKELREKSKVLEWLHQFGNLEYIYEEGRPQQAVPVIRLNHVNFDFDEMNIVQVVNKAAALQSGGKGGV